MIFLPNSLNSKLPPATAITALLNEWRQARSGKPITYIPVYYSTIDYKSLLKTIAGLINLVMSLCGTIFTFSLVSFYAGELLRYFLILSLTIISTTFSSSFSPWVYTKIKVKFSFLHGSFANFFQTTNSSKLISNVDMYFVVATRGLFSYDPAQSCKEIKDLGISNGDGEYWIDPGRTKSPFKAYCDMTTDGGKVWVAADIACVAGVERGRG